VTLLVDNRHRIDSIEGPERYWFQLPHVKAWRWLKVVAWMAFYPLWLARAWLWYADRSRGLEWCIWSPASAWALTRDHYCVMWFTTEELLFDLDLADALEPAEPIGSVG